MLLFPFPSDANPRLDDFVLTPTTAVALLTSTVPAATCPRCGTPSGRVHSRYRRTLADLPCRGRPLALRLAVRRFRCARAEGPQAVFCERLPDLAGPRARSTGPLDAAHRDIGLALGGEAGARLATRLDMPTSPDTLLRRVQGAADAPAPAPRHVGVDDWAICKGQVYGTILVDLERGCVLDILEGRDGSALTAWLKEHPGVEVITRDRWAAFIQAATEGAPQATQVADRWHLLKNLREAVEQLLARLSTHVREALQQTPGPADHHADEVPAPAGPPVPVSPPPGADRPRQGQPASAAAAPPKEQARQAKRQGRVERYERVRQLRAEGLSVRQIAQATGLSTGCVLRYLRAEHCPDWGPGRPRRTQLGRFAEHIDAWVARGGRNAADLHRELAGLGSKASYDAVRRYPARRLGSTGRPGPRVGPLPAPAVPAPPSARQLSFEFLRKPEDRKGEEQAHVDRLLAGEAALREGLDLAGEFAAMVRKRSEVSLAEWLVKAAASSCAELQNFAASLRTDEVAVAAALATAWSNGPVEGHVNRLKLIKRQMYGRAGFRLLRARVLSTR